MCAHGGEGEVGGPVRNPRFSFGSKMFKVFSGTQLRPEIKYSTSSTEHIQSH
jgi:hypothetical protein